MSDTTVLLHGWSDSSSSFMHMKDFLVRNGIGPTYAPGLGRTRSHQFLVRAVDDQGLPIDDLTLELTISKASQRTQGGCVRPTEGGTPTFFFPTTITLLEIMVDRVNDHVFLGPDPRRH